MSTGQPTAVGPLHGIRVIEIAGMGPGPFCAMLLSDMGAEVIRVDRADAVGAPESQIAARDLMNRGRKSIAVDLKQVRGVETVLRLIDTADVVLEGFRPGVVERLGIGPEVCLSRNPKLVYGRMTGWGQDGPYSGAAGHDLNYIALSGALEQIGQRGGPPTPPLNLVGDFGGGAMLLAFGILCAVIESRTSGSGQVVDAAMVDGAALLTTCIHMLRATGRWNGERGENSLAGGSHWYHVYECSDGRYVTIAAAEPQFYSQVLSILGFDAQEFPQHDESLWPELTERFAERILTKTSAEWEQLMGGTDTCFAPVLSPWEAHLHPHNAHRQTFLELDGIIQPAPAPRFSRSEPKVQGSPPLPGAHTDQILAAIGCSPSEIDDLLSSGAVA